MCVQYIGLESIHVVHDVHEHQIDIGADVRFVVAAEADISQLERHSEPRAGGGL